jgi:cohesin complex subunit SA-1/2
VTEDESDDDEDSDAESLDVIQKKNGKKKAKAKSVVKKRTATTVTKTRVAKKTKVATGRSPSSFAAPAQKRGGRAIITPSGSGGNNALHPERQTAKRALGTLAKSVLPEGESPGLRSLVAGLLHSHRPPPKGVELGDIPKLSECTANLVVLAREVVKVHNANMSNLAQLSLLNLLFRSVGGTPDTDLSMGGKKKSSRGKKDDDSEMMETEDDDEEGDEEEVILDDMDANDWARVVTDLVDDMRHVPANRILLCADPLGAVHQSQELLEREKDDGGGGEGKSKGADITSNTAYAAAIEYRKIYEEFWYILGHVALTEGGMASSSGRNDFSRVDEDDDDGDGEEAPVVRLDAELVRTIVLRVVELSPVGQPDVRAAATLAALGLAHATLERSVILTRKMDVAARQYAAAKKATGGGGKKAEALKVRMESLKRTVEDLDEVVLGPVIQGLFVHRYRDSNEHIRTMCISSLSRMALQRPDIFLTDKYTKYFGWMMHDKDHRVRCASLEGLHLPFKAVSDLAEGKARLLGDDNLMIEKIELTRLEQVVAKFLPRIVDSVLDPVGTVQVVAMNLMLALLKGGFLDDVNDDKLWDQTNQRSLANDAPPSARKNALYFILEQLEAFDDGGENEKAAPNERKRAQQLDAIASYAAHTLTNGPVPIDKIHVETADLLVKSLREMPEHRGLVTDWSAMLRAIKDDNVAATATLITAGDRANVAKQRVLVRMLACAAREEVGAVADHEFLSRGTDAHAMEVTTTVKSKGKKTPTVGREHENLSIALLKALPNLLIQFKGDLAIIPELVSLPRFLIPTVFSLPQRRQDFMDLIKNLGEIYLSSSDTRILDNTARSLVSLCNGDHARAAESNAQLRKVVVELRDRVVDLMTSGDDGTTIATSAISVSDFTSVARSRRSSGRKKVPAGSPSSDKTSLTDDDTKGTSDADAEYSIFLNLKRLKILSKKCDLSVFFDDRNNVNQLEMLCNYITIGLKSRLRASKPVDLRLNADEETTVHKLIDNPNVLAACGKSVGEGLEFLLCVLGWFVNSVHVSENLIMDEHDIIDNAMEDDEEEDKAVEDHVVIRLRDGLMTILELCFAQYIPNSFDHGDGESTAVQHSEEQHSFSDYVQLAAGKTTSDLRTLFPKEYADAASPILRSFALQDDGRLIGANVRFLDSKEYLLRDSDAGASVAEMKLSHSLLYPLGRAIATNWTNGNRREAGVFLRHIGGSGPTAAEIVTTTSRQMKKIDPVRMLESQMASLRQSYEYWVDATPELETDFPSEEEMAMFEDEEKTHKEQYAKLEHRASQFSQTLGVFGKLGSPTLGPALRGFIREGIRFSFSNLDENGEDSLVLGSRLSFLLLLSKYASWAKKDKKHKSDISDYVDGLESDMRNHSEFDEVHADDLESLATFRNIMGLKALSLKSSNASVVSGRSGRSNVTDGEESDESLDNVSDLPSPVPSMGSKSTRASRSSRLSSMLPTLPEADKEESPQDGDSDSDTHFSATSPRDSHEKSRSQSQMTYEHSGDESDVSSVPPVKTKVRQTKKRKN